MSIVAYRNRTTGQYPITDAILRQEYPALAIPAVLTEAEFDFFNIDPVFATPQPALTRLQTAQEVEPVETNGTWAQQWQVVDITAGMSADQLAALKQQIATEQAAAFNNARDAMIAAGFSYDFSAFKLASGQQAGTLIMQMGADDQTNWLGLTLQAQIAIAKGQGSAMMELRVLENVWVQMAATDILGVLEQSGAWKSATIKACSDAKDTMTALVADTSKGPADVLAVQPTWL